MDPLVRTEIDIDCQYRKAFRGAVDIRRQRFRRQFADEKLDNAQMIEFVSERQENVWKMILYWQTAFHPFLFSI